MDPCPDDLNDIIPYDASQNAQGEYSMDRRLTLMEFNGICKNLENISDTRADLWALLNVTQAKGAQRLRCRYPRVLF